MQWFKDVVNFLSQPQYYILLSMAGLLGLVYTRVAWNKAGLLAGTLALTLFFSLSALDPNFHIIISKADNIPIIIMVYLVWLALWGALSQGVANDDRMAMGLPSDEAQEGGKKVWCWPDLVYIELLSMLLVGALLVVWSVVLKAPLEEPANPVLAPNPSKAPWYFLGLQEMLVYFDPWLAGVVFPSLIILGLMAVPYIDPNPLGNGYYTFRQRRFAVTWFLFGFVVLWCVLIFLGTFLRGPNWNFFGPYEVWDIHKLEALVNVNLSEYFWIRLLGQPLPSFWLVRELPGFVAVGAYFSVAGWVLSRTYLRPMHRQMSRLRFAILMLLFLAMMALPIKMVLRWLFNLKYLIAIPEYFFNI
jgi:hypothetical protein